MSPIQFIRKQVFSVSQSEFAAILDVSQSTVSRWERGVSPSLDEMSKIRCAAVERGVSWSDSFFFDVPNGVAQ
ncbi:helix-turn-helix domain-containing protein [Agrobacterium vitis]|uniref:Helix-turn-helix domain-containing protein n=1 Tax=Agrobacterium vitis TaxID=373 RepID=A0AAE2RAU1_AGRVI|nr:helix-turn-helix domain-containing protein [Agrobacterium vitis]MVA62496.1 helix-turn-helix domain-containing protein [Agrobacterium vitis]